MAASDTAPSIQPPLTDPAMRPDLVTTNWLPAGRGELPQVSVTVATATCSPSAFQADAIARMSSGSLLMPNSLILRCERDNRLGEEVRGSALSTPARGKPLNSQTSRGV